MTLTSTAVRDIPPIRHDEAMGLAAAEYQRFGALLHDLAPGDWTTATVCDRWDVRAVAAHVLGAAEACASSRENVHQMRLGHQVQRQLRDAAHPVLTMRPGRQKCRLSHGG